VDDPLDRVEKTERDVKQELYAHALLINIARIFEIEANNQFPSQLSPNQEENEKISRKIIGKIFLVRYKK